MSQKYFTKCGRMSNIQTRLFYISAKNNPAATTMAPSKASGPLQFV